MADSSKASPASSPKQVILHVRIGVDLIGKIDAHAKRKDLTRSNVVRDMIKAWAKGK